MSILDLLRKGFGYVLMSLGASSPDAARKKSAAQAASDREPKPASDSQQHS